MARIPSLDPGLIPSSAAYGSVLDTIGATPVVRLSRLPGSDCAAVFVKLEQLSPTGSMKDRLAFGMIERAEEEGRLAPGGTVVEATSGNTGVGLALVCAVKGYKLVVAMPESMSLERRELLRSYGAKVELTPADRNLEGAIARAREIAAGLPGAFFANQFENPTNPEVYEATTAQELLDSARADGGQVDAFVLGVGSGGALTGIGRGLKAAMPEVRLFAVEPVGAEVLAGKTAGPHRIQGLGVGFVPGTLERGFERVLAVSDRAAWEMKERLAREEGLLVGISSGANVRAALEVARELGPGKAVYTLCCDTGERYFSLSEYFR